jgi:hypothetical protein
MCFSAVLVMLLPAPCRLCLSQGVGAELPAAEPVWRQVMQWCMESILTEAPEAVSSQDMYLDWHPTIQYSRVSKTGGSVPVLAHHLP